MSSIRQAASAIRVVTALLLAMAPLSAQRVNFAKFQKVTSSGQLGSYSPDLAVDGLVSNFHSFRTADTDGPHWIELAFPRPLAIASAHLYLGLDNDPQQGLSSFRFQYHDGSGWHDVPGSSVAGNTATELSVIFTDAVVADRFRLWTDDSGSRVIRELALFPPDPGDGNGTGFPIGTDVRLNLAYQRPATSSSANIANANGPGYARNAFDGYIDNLSRWVGDHAAGEWLEVDLLEDHVVGSAHVFSGFIAATEPRETIQPMPDFKLQYWNGTGWLDIPGADITGNTEVARAISFASNVTTSRVRIVNTSEFNGRVQELLLFPPRDGGYDPGREIIDAPPPAARWDDLADSSYRIRSGIPDGRFLGFQDGGVRFSGGNLDRDALGWQVLLNHRDGSYRIRHNATGKCLALDGISFADHNLVILEDYSGLPHQDWHMEFVGVFGGIDHHRFVNAYSGMVLQTRYGSWDFGNPMSVRPPADDSAVQRWRLIDPVHHPKKGIAATANPARTVPWGGATWMDDSWDKLNGPSHSWSYSWGRQTSDTFPYMGASHTFNPMQWGDFNWDHNSNRGPIDTLRRDLQSSGKPAYLMGFNEPEKVNQGFITVADAITRWPRLEAMDVPLVSPAPASAFNGWLADFSDQADLLGYRRDYTAVHWYSGPNASNLINHLQNNYQTFGRPVWLTEFSAVRWSGGATWTHADNYEFLAEFMWRAESLPWLKRYALFQFVAGPSDNPNQSANDPPEAPRSNARNADGTLTPFGELYAAWDGVTDVLPHRAYHIHNSGRYERLLNSGATSASFTEPENSGTGTQWFLTPGTTADTFRLISTRDGRPLRFVEGSAVTLGNVGQDNPAVEWRLIPVTDGHGRHFIEHPATGQRLKNLGGGEPGMVSSGNSGIDIQWRFINALDPDPAGPPAIPGPPVATASSTFIDLSWSAVAGAVSYTVRRSEAPDGPWVTVADGITGTGWTDTGLAGETESFYQLIATNSYGLDSAPSTGISATTLHPLATYEGWLAETMDGDAPGDRLPGADPDHDRRPNLIEFAFLTDPARPDPSPFRVIWAAAGALTLEFPWNWRATGLTWRLRHGTDLGNPAEWPVIDPGTVTTVRDGDIDIIRCTPAMAGPDRGFYVLEVVAP